MSLPFRVSMSATDPDEAHGWLTQAYMPYTVRLTGNRADFRARHRGADFDGFSAGILEHSITADLYAEPLKDFLLVVQPLSGRYAVTSGKDEIYANPGECLVYNPDVPSHIWQQNVALSIIRFDRAQLSRAAAELTGNDDTAALEFSLSRPVSAERSRRWQRLVQYLADNVAGPASASPLVRSQSLRLAAATLLETFPNSALAPDPTPEGHADAHALSRAVDFIEASAARDITMSEVATAAKVNNRALQFAFRSRLHTTPLAYLRRVRLERAHDELRALTPDSGVTITDLARRWGFESPGRFASEYRQRYGCLPHQTLRA